ncbi:MAG: DUF3570 domain-containing protein [Verrucomicrobia bacterium]|nr:DUF3570 domain-containing protein [Verrucomicrobiota bacterium]
MLASAFLADWLLGGRARAEQQLGYRYSYYQEDDHRIRVETHSVIGEVAPTAWMSLKAQLVQDAISGATPTGSRPDPVTGELPFARLVDRRRAADLEGTFRLDRLTLRPAFSYSVEDDYRSTGFALNGSFDFNDRNTTLNLGCARNNDFVFPARRPQEFGKAKELGKHTTDVLLGVNQVLTAKTLLTVNFTLGFANGYLSDPYKAVTFERLDTSFNDYYEMRPHHRFKQIGYVQLTQFVDALDASVEASYRPYHDTWGIWSHTAGVQWFQKFGRHVIIAPLFRYMQQTKASFYQPFFYGDPRPVFLLDDPNDALTVPGHYSSDYRLGALHTLTYGAEATVLLTEKVHLNLSYSRYEMHSDRSNQPADAFAKAHIFTIGIRAFF